MKIVVLTKETKNKIVLPRTRFPVESIVAVIEIDKV